MLRRNQNRKRRGFTLMEVLLVMAILIILASLVTVGYQAIRKNANRDGAAAQIKALETACMVYLNDVGQLPTDLNDLRQPPQGLSNPDKWRGPYMDTDIPADPWQQPYQYEQTVDQYQNPRPMIYSFGPDMAKGTQDDISNQPTGSTT